MATNKNSNPLITEGFILGVNSSYTPAAGTRYEVVQDKIVTMQKVTPKLVKDYNALRLSKTEITDDDAQDTGASIDVLISRCQCITGNPEGINWEDGSMKVMWRIVEDFLFLSSPSRQPRAKS